MGTETSKTGTDKPETDGKGFGVTADKSDETLKGNSDAALDSKLDESLEETFPGSDPVSVKITK